MLEGQSYPSAGVSTSDLSLWAYVVTTSYPGYSAFYYVADGTNDSAVINQAIADMTAGGGTVQLAQGTFRPTSTIIPTCDFIGSGSNTILQGQSIIGPVLTIGNTTIFTASIAVTGIMTVTAVSGGSIQIGQIMMGSGVPNGTTITSQLTGTTGQTGQTGTYQTSTTTAVASTQITATPTGGAIAGRTLGNFTVSGTATQCAVAFTGCQTCRVLPIWGKTTGCIDTFNIMYVWACTFDGLSTFGSTAARANFYIWDYTNSCTFNNLYTSNLDVPYNFLINSTGGGSDAPTALTFNSPVIQGGRQGMLFGGAKSITVNAPYAENVVNLFRFGDKINNKTARAITVNSPVSGGPAKSHPSAQAAVAAFDFDNCKGITISSPEMPSPGSLVTTVTFTAGAGAGGSAIAIIDQAGKVQAIQIINGGSYTAGPYTCVVTDGGANSGLVGATILTPGSGGTNGTYDLIINSGGVVRKGAGTFTVAGGAVTAVTITAKGQYTGTPTFSLTSCPGLTGASVAATMGNGTGFAGTVNLTGTRISSVTITNAGVGYSMPLGTIPTMVIYNFSAGTVINAPFSNYGKGTQAPVYPWIVKRSTADGGATVGVNDDYFDDDGGNNYAASCSFKKAQGFGNQHVIVAADSSGTPINRAWVPPTFIPTT